VSWFDAVRFCNAQSAKVGLRAAYEIGSGDAPSVRVIDGADGFRLPTEAEWECAARAGAAHVYAGGDDLDAVAWHSGNSGRTTHAVGQKRANAWGLHDLSGNVWEWCQDWVGDYASGAATDPQGASSGSGRVRRGGSWYDTAQYARVALRYGNDPGYRNVDVGVRLTRTIP
jgi:formylglycine-generating enzyme required for sulfatase activity